MLDIVRLHATQPPSSLEAKSSLNILQRPVFDITSDSIMVVAVKADVNALAILVDHVDGFISKRIADVKRRAFRSVVLTEVSRDRFVVVTIKAGIDLLIVRESWNVAIFISEGMSDSWLVLDPIWGLLVESADLGRNDGDDGKPGEKELGAHLG